MLNHIKKEYWDYVYEPAEDTFLLLDALEKDLDYIISKKPATILEIGSGSGTIITALSTLLKSSYHLAIDINKYACSVTMQNSHYNKVIVDVINTDLTSCLKLNCIDVIIFNPPYVVTPNDEIYKEDPLTKSWAGGVNGRVIIDKFLHVFDRVLSSKGFGYLLVIKENQPHEIITKLKEKNYKCEIYMIRKIRCEELYIIKFIKNF
ncbi:N5-glutamine methyltransferase MTQ2, putative [Pediculus humanus corporis]|uniref:Methyltransferase HEMK2 n=1 Tax=Pediculus humanus subsp. corporis TaxID=121224 RepID=E0W0C7_PEDHC|nr:N5-glutamine methyltransferase MTQ2, putative [Pediculus humanus corporis]EEB19083.1 N5-glutamine methyltransferase MTQ2, putative [Pediculus humanus corporis]